MRTSHVTTMLLALSSLAVAQEHRARVKVVLGDTHGVQLKADGTVWVWGVNSKGQLGMDDGRADSPKPVPELSGIVDVAAGDQCTAAVKGDGTLWTWGANQDGQLGNGTTRDSHKPAQVTSLTKITAVAASGRHMLALQADGTVWEWGHSDVKRLSFLPDRVDNFAGVVAIAASNDHSVALKSDGTVWAWGDLGLGDLGNDRPAGQTILPLQLPGLSDITAIAAGSHLTVALKKDGTVWDVGYGMIGGSGIEWSETHSVQPVRVSGLLGIQAIAASHTHALALKNDGTVWSWGDNQQGELGNILIQGAEWSRPLGRGEPGNGHIDKVATPVRSGMLAGVVAIGAATWQSAAITGSGLPWIWGQNEDGWMGVAADTLEQSDIPMRVGQSVPPKCLALFSCGTASGKIIQICGKQDPKNLENWSDIQYRFGPQYGPQELVFPTDASKGRTSLFFSFDPTNFWVRFSNGVYTYRVFGTYSGGPPKAGVEVEDGAGRKLSTISCGSAIPEVHFEFLRDNLPCDAQSPHGVAACKAQ